jgi:transcriptional regulator with XRE-family HTH domain
MKEKLLNKVLTRIGVTLSNLRMRKGYSSIKDFANEYDLPLIQYWKIEKGKTNLTIKSLMKLLAIHRIPIQDFFCLLDEKR